MSLHCLFSSTLGGADEHYYHSIFEYKKRCRLKLHTILRLSSSHTRTEACNMQSKQRVDTGVIAALIELIIDMN